MSALEIKHAALEHGGVLVRLVGYRGPRSELRLALRIEADRRRYDLREWYEHSPGDWRPGRHGISGLAGADLRALVRLLRAAAVVIPQRRRARVANGEAA
jgi:hypothetical protein